MLHRFIDNAGMEDWSVIRQVGLSSFLKTAVMLACFQSSGTWSVLYDCWNMTLSTGAISSDANLSILAGTKSGPDAFAEFRLLSNFLMLGAVNIQCLALKKLDDHLCQGGFSCELGGILRV